MDLYCVNYVDSPTRGRQLNSDGNSHATLQSAPAPASSIAGTWARTWTWTQCPAAFSCELGVPFSNVLFVLNQAGQTVTGTAFTENNNSLAGTYSGAAFTYTVTYTSGLGISDNCNFTVNGTTSGSTLQGTCTAVYSGGNGAYTITATKQ